MDEKILAIVKMLQEIQEDTGVPKNVKEKIGETMKILGEQTENSMKASKAMQALESITEDANMPSYNRMQLFNIISALEIV